MSGMVQTAVAAMGSAAVAAGATAVVDVTLMAARRVYSAAGVAVGMGVEHSPGVVAEVEMQAGTCSVLVLRLQSSLSN